MGIMKKEEKRLATRNGRRESMDQWRIERNELVADELVTDTTNGRGECMSKEGPVVPGSKGVGY
jgi:hypothetical protein